VVATLTNKRPLSVIDKPQPHNTMRTINWAANQRSPGTASRLRWPSRTRRGSPFPGQVLLPWRFTMPTRRGRDLSGSTRESVLGMDHVGPIRPGFGRLDAADNDYSSPMTTELDARLAYETDYGVTRYTRTMITACQHRFAAPQGTLASLTRSLSRTITGILRNEYRVRRRGSDRHEGRSIPAKSGDPSLIKHVFRIIRENRTTIRCSRWCPVGNGNPQATWPCFVCGHAEYACDQSNGSRCWTISFSL